jgi:hypothetical protein
MVDYFIMICNNSTEKGANKYLMELTIAFKKS